MILENKLRGSIREFEIETLNAPELHLDFKFRKASEDSSKVSKYEREFTSEFIRISYNAIELTKLEVNCLQSHPLAFHQDQKKSRDILISQVAVLS